MSYSHSSRSFKMIFNKNNFYIIFQPVEADAVVDVVLVVIEVGELPAVRGPSVTGTTVDPVSAAIAICTSLICFSTDSTLLLSFSC